MRRGQQVKNKGVSQGKKAKLSPNHQIKSCISKVNYVVAHYSYVGLTIPRF
jgi:hypothetical protein